MPLYTYDDYKTICRSQIFFCTLGPRDLTQVSHAGKNSLYLISHLASMRQVLCHPGWLQTQYIAEDELELLICLPLLPDAKITDASHGP